MKIISIIVVAILAIGVIWFVFSPIPKEREGISVDTTIEGQLYVNPTFAFEIKVAPGFTVDESYLNQTLGPGKEIPGIAFTIPASLTQGTNLSGDSKLAVEELTDVACMPSDFLPVTSLGTPVTVGANDFTYATSSGAGAGNFYDESVYITRKDNRCYAIRYLIHSTNIYNYDPGTVAAFDRESLIKSMDAMTATFEAH